MDNEWLRRQFREHPDKSKAALAEALGLDRPAISKILAGTRQIKAAEYAGMRRFFGLPVDGEGAARPGGVVVRPLGLAEEGSDAEAARWILPASLLASRTKEAPRDIRLFTVPDDAMTPELARGETVLVDMADTVPSPPGLFVLSDGMGSVIRRCAPVPRSQPPQVRISAASPHYEAYTQPLRDAAIAGRVIAKLQWL